MLDTQIQILSVDTGNFYFDDERELHNQNRFVRIERKKLINGYTEKFDNKKMHIQGIKELLKELKKYNYTKCDVNKICKNENLFDKNVIQNSKISNDIKILFIKYRELLEEIKIYGLKAKEAKKQLLNLLSDRVEYNLAQTNEKDKHIRILNEESIYDKKTKELITKNIISIFDSSSTRILNAKKNTFTDDLIVIQVYYFDIIKDLICNGFYYKGEKYIYFTSSAGQIRTKKTVFIKEKVWKQNEKTIMCGLTIEEINKLGGNNPNKHLAYLALNNSATDVWNEFDIDKCIVINDFETNVMGTYDLIDEISYSIHRTTDYVPITHTDGVGMILPKAFGVRQHNKMIRLPWIKGLLGVFDFIKFIKHNNCSSEITDIYGVKHDILKEDIQVILTESQFKMHKYYKDFTQYKQFFKKYNCQACFTNPEENNIRNAKINYQMLQSLTDISDEEILSIAQPSIDKVVHLCDNIQNVKEAFGVHIYNQNKTYLQQAIDFYPTLINDEYLKNKLRNIKNSMIKRYKAGKLEVNGKYTFVMPDFYAACEYWFMGIENPNGLLDDKEVYCSLYNNNQELDCLRSPHLYREHAVRTNCAYVHNDKVSIIKQWFQTKAIYTSCKDLISKILMFDVDGDKLLVIANQNIIDIAKRNMNDIVPLYYNMKKAQPRTLTPENLYEGLRAAFVGGNIGIYSNNISKIWNDEVFISGTEEEKQRALDIIKLLCMENNFCIDYAKTLYKPQRPNDINQKILQYTQKNLPHFFKYAKDKEDKQIEVANDSLVNKLDKYIPNPRLNFKSLGLEKIDYTLLMDNVNVNFDCELELNGKINEARTDPIIKTFNKLTKEYIYKIDLTPLEQLSPEVRMLSNVREQVIYKDIIDTVKLELSQFGYTQKEVADILVKFAYGVKPNYNKDILWLCYGKYLLHNLKKHIKFLNKEVRCNNCNQWIRVDRAFNLSNILCEKCKNK